MDLMAGRGGGRTWRVFRHELITTARNPSFLIALVIQCLFVMVCLVVVFVLVNVLFPGGMRTRMRYNIGVFPSEDNFLIDYLAGPRSARVRPYVDLESAQADFQQGRLCTLVVLPADLDRFRDSANQIIVSVVSDDTKLYSTVCKNYIMRQLELLNYQLKLERGLDAGLVLFRTDFEEDPNFTFYLALYFFMIPFVFIFPCLVMSTLAVDLFTPELEGGVAESLLSAALPRDVVYGRYWALMTLSFVQFVFWVVVFSLQRLVFGDPVGVLIVSVCLCALIIGVATLLIARNKDRNATYVQLSMLMFAALVITMPLRSLSVVRAISPLEVYPRLFFGLGSWWPAAFTYAAGAALCVSQASKVYGLRTG